MSKSPYTPGFRAMISQEYSDGLLNTGCMDCLISKIKNGTLPIAYEVDGAEILLYNKCTIINSTLNTTKGALMIIIDYQDRRPIYEQIVEKIQMLIIKDILKADSQLPSVRKLAMDLSINPNTIQKAYAILEQQGFIYPVKGRGNFVAQNPAGLKKKKEELYDQIRSIVIYAKDLNVTKEEFVGRVTQYYGEESYD